MNKMILGLTILFAIWLTPGWWNLGLTVIGLIFLGNVYRSYDVKKDKWALAWLVGCGIIFIFQAFRAAGVNRFFNIVTLGLIVPLIVAVRSEKAELSILRTGLTWMTLMPRTLINFFLVRKLAPTKEGVKLEKIKSIILGIVLALPLLLVFGSLFASADPEFARLINSFKLPKIIWDGEFWGKVVLTLLFGSWLLTVITTRIMGKEVKFPAIKEFEAMKLALVLVEILFTVFIGFQIKYLLMPTETLRSLGISLSEYTRRGYGEMMVAGILILAMLTGLAMMKSSRKLRNISVIMAVQLGLIVLAATNRNYIYQNIHGFTQARLLGFFLSAGLGAAVVVVVNTLSQQKSEDFLVKAYLTIVLAVVVAINAANLDRMVAVVKQPNLGYGIDYRYLASLSNDGWEAWDGVLNNIESETRSGQINDWDKYFSYSVSLTELQRKYQKLTEQKKNYWQWGGAWNLNDVRAEKFLEENIGRIEGLRFEIS